jgi:hypothetical protein
MLFDCLVGESEQRQRHNDVISLVLGPRAAGTVPRRGGPRPVALPKGSLAMPEQLDAVGQLLHREVAALTLHAFLPAANIAIADTDDFRAAL